MILYELKILKINLHKIQNLNKNDNSIPKFIFQTWYTLDLPPKMRENVELLKQQNPEFEHYLFNDEECIQFIKDNFDQNVVDAYNSLVPGAYKADLWRYCILYIYGGIYLDIKYNCINNFKLINLTNKENFVRDAEDIYMNMHNTNIYNALLITLPNNEILLKCINQIVKNVKNNYYGYNCLYPTGPALLGSFFNLDDIKLLELNHQYKIINNFIYRYIYYNNTIILKEYDEYRTELNKYQNISHYGLLWHNKHIYTFTDYPQIN
jgi:mannosyltransferase OCH1-like enzyme